MLKLLHAAGVFKHLKTRKRRPKAKSLGDAAGAPKPQAMLYSTIEARTPHSAAVHKRNLRPVIGRRR